MSETKPGKVFAVLFLCTGNSCRSIMAEAIMNRAGLGRFQAFSAGSMPTGKVNPHALDLLKQMHHDVSGLRSKPWEEFSRDSKPEAPDLDFVFTVCDNAAGEVCPYWPGQPMTAHWGMPDPAEVVGTEEERHRAFADTLTTVSRRIDLFLALPVEKLDRMYNHLIGCRVSVENLHRQHRTGNVYEVHIELRVPGEDVVVGAPTADAPGAANGGALYAFRAGGEWEDAQTARLAVTGIDAGDQLGYAVAIDADLVAASAPFGSAGLSGSVHVLTRDLLSW